MTATAMSYPWMSLVRWEFHQQPQARAKLLWQAPVLAAILTDPRGTTAKIRMGNRRYGQYVAPPTGRFYYAIYDLDDARERFADARPAPSFEHMVQPLGFELPLDEHGDLRKVSVITEDEPYVLVDAATAPEPTEDGADDLT